jgi:hypothetical protein
MLKFENFNSFKEIKVNCSQTLSSIFSLEFIPNKKLVLDSSLGKMGLDIEFLDAVSLYFSNLQGIDLNTLPDFGFLTQLNLKKDSILQLDYSTIQFYLNGNVFTESNCYKYNDFNFLTRLIGLIFDKYNVYSTKIPPIIFSGSDLTFFSANYITNSLISKNKLEFVDSFNCSGIVLKFFERLDLKIDYDTITTRIVNKDLFKNMLRFYFEGLIYDIQADLFKHFAKLSYVSLILEKIESFYHNGNNWLSYLGYGKDPTEKLLVQIWHSNNILAKTYDYPDEDFCLFAHFPHERLVYPVIRPEGFINCSCTVLWLVQNTLLFFSKEKISASKYTRENGYVLTCILLPNHNELFKSCNFSRKKENCNKTNYKPIALELNEKEFVYALKLVEFLMLVVLNPALGLTGILTNSVVVIVVNNIKKHKINDAKKKYSHMFNHILINSSFNVIYCLVVCSKLLNECLALNSSLFCSSLLKYKSAQIFKIVFIEYFGNVLAICCNISYIGIIISRFLIYKQSRVFNCFRRIKMWVYLIFVLAFSLGLSVFKLYEYKLDKLDYTSLNTNYFPTEIRRLFDYCGTIPNKETECKYFNLVVTINNIINNVLFFPFALFLDLILIRNVSRHSSAKKSVNGKEDSSNCEDIKIKKMIIINGIVFAIAHLPEFITQNLLFVFELKMVNFCFFKMECEKFNEISRVFNHVSIIAQLVINKNYNGIFNDSYQQIKLNLIRKFKSKSKNDDLKNIDVN